MIKIIGVKFGEKSRIYYFSPNGIKLEKENKVIVETEKGTQFGEICTDEKISDEKNIVFPLKSIIRVATKDDLEKQEQNIESAKKALMFARQVAKEKNIEMNIIDSIYTFDKSKLIFKFIADDRVDFRELLKELTNKYKTRIDLKQIGIRDKAKEVGGLGQCGRQMCCTQFLLDFDSISINMAKNQNLALNPSKINGSCGRLLCCLSYEDEEYTKNKETLPKIGEKVTKDGFQGRVFDLDIINKKYKIKNDKEEIREYTVD